MGPEQVVFFRSDVGTAKEIVSVLSNITSSEINKIKY